MNYKINIYSNFNKYILFTKSCIQYTKLAGWQSGYAAACKAVNAGSIPASASINLKTFKFNKV